MYGAPWFRKASEEKKFDCCAVRFDAPVSKAAGNPAAKKMNGTMIATAPSIAMTCMKSVSTEARKPDHRVYNSTPPATANTPWMKLKGESMEISTPTAMKLDISEITEPTTLEPASISWLERP